jgi:hypothetical protein
MLPFDFISYPARRRLNRQEGLADLVKRGRQLINAGKIGDARVLLRIAAEANDATAAFVLATTYDSIFAPTIEERRFIPRH